MNKSSGINLNDTKSIFKKHLNNPLSFSFNYAHQEHLLAFTFSHHSIDIALTESL